MELVEGELLRDLLSAGPIPLQKVIRVAAQTADGLAKAHEAGVIHRDLKPENLMVSRDGFVKILDFGLAKLASQPAKPFATPWHTNDALRVTQCPQRRALPANSPRRMVILRWWDQSCGARRRSGWQESPLFFRV